MDITVTPRKETDTGGYFCMPLLTNIPKPRNKWKLTRCPECGAYCWEIPLAETVKKQGCKGLCTMCALKKGVMVR